MNMKKASDDKAGEEYWSKEWENYKVPDPDSIPLRTAANYLQWSYHELFTELFNDKSPEGLSILEIGCGNSAWLPYFNRYWKMEVTGIDYSEVGCKKAEFIMQKASATGKVILADMFDPPEELKGKFDIVCSFGVIEHFKDTTKALMAASAFVRPGGYLLTTVPNMQGVNGMMQKMFSKQIFDIHEILGPADLVRSLPQGFEPLRSGFFINFSFYANPGIPGKGNSLYKLKRSILKITSLLSRVMWWLELHMFSFKGASSYSSAVYCFARFNK
jgi:SAM-dependent methyltransferase